METPRVLTLKLLLVWLGAAFPSATFKNCLSYAYKGIGYWWALAGLLLPPAPGVSTGLASRGTKALQWGKAEVLMEQLGPGDAVLGVCEPLLCRFPHAVGLDNAAVRRKVSALCCLPRRTWVPSPSMERVCPAIHM